jgi:hypothetical protein
MAWGQTARDLLSTHDDRDASRTCEPWFVAAHRSIRLGVTTVLWLLVSSALGCTQNLTAVESSGGVGGSTSNCDGQECAGDGQCCANYACKFGRCVAEDAGFYAGPGQVCSGATGCMQVYGVYSCETVESTSLCLSASAAKNGAPCQLAADCASLHCEAGTCRAGAACGVSGAECSSGADCCSNQCGPDDTCINEDKSCRVVGDTCTTSSDCCSANSCSKIGNTYRCVATSGCRGSHDVCGEAGCCQGVSACSQNRCVESSCSQRDTPCWEDKYCCSQQCVMNSSNTGRICAALDGCQPFAERCTDDWECCSGNCDSKKGRCSSTSQCAQEGETCSEQRDCCPEPGLSCVADLTGAKRCSSATACVENWGTCFFGSQCCSARCDYDTLSDKFRCNSYCGALDEPCNSRFDCCANYCSPEGRCAKATEW